MERPIALRLTQRMPIDVYSVSVDPIIARKINSTHKQECPAIIVVSSAEIIPNISTGVIDSTDVISVTEGNWNNAILLVLPNLGKEGSERKEGVTMSAMGDAKFLARVERDAKNIAPLAYQTLLAIREAGVDGELVEMKNGRWVNRPLNTFTLKVQPRVGNLHFTIYGDPESYDSDGFLLKDQNSYSRGWVRNISDARKLASFVKQSHSRKNR